MGLTLQEQAESFYRAVSEFARSYQFRDRDQICRHGVSVTQCYALELLDTQESMTMGQLAAGLYLDLSTVTRAIDQLVQLRLVKRESDPSDRRVCRIRPTSKGLQLIEKIRAELIEQRSRRKDYGVGYRAAIFKCNRFGLYTRRGA